jgi:hypothetical protein
MKYTLMLMLLLCCCVDPDAEPTSDARPRGIYGELPQAPDTSVTDTTKSFWRPER